MPKPRFVKNKIKTDKSNKSTTYFRSIRYPNISISSDDVYITAGVNQRLDLLAKNFYNDVELWWVINIANPNLVPRDSIYIPIGAQVRIPANINAVIEQFEEINK
tara:strand:+ start:28 stop:342 length:315 start_codon:yes stop_codon:yes gene_type:complete